MRAVVTPLLRARPLQRSSDVAVNRDIVVVGSSAGGVDALPRLMNLLPRDLRASVFICQHQAPTSDPQLVNILRRTAQIPISWAEQGESFERGHVYVAPPDVHLTFTDHHVQLMRGPRENYARPSIDRLFRSAAATHGTHTIAVILTGMMADGVAGALAVQRAGGRVLVQDPQDAAFPELPTRTLAALTPDATLGVERLAATLVELTQEDAPTSQIPADITLEHEFDAKTDVSPSELDRIGTRSIINCPDCGGSLWAVGSPGVRRWRCYLNHVTNPADLLARSQNDVEAALWNAVRALRERAATLDRLGTDARMLGAEVLAVDYEVRAVETREHAELVRQFMIDLLERSR